MAVPVTGRLSSDGVRTLVISDLHLGARLQHSVLRQSQPLQRLLDALEDAERLVLLGDTIELLEQRPQPAMQAAEPVLRAIGTRLGPEREVIIVPGNHDFALVRSWVRPRVSELAVDSAIPVDATPGLAQLAVWLAPAQVTVRYPGVWLADRVWATHGHYLDRHLLPESAFGIARGVLGRVPREGAAPADYELAGGVSVTRIEARLTRSLPRPLAALVEDAAELARAVTMPLPRWFLHRRIARLTATLLGLQMRRASIPALATVTRRLRVDADWVLFGHVHRLGPLSADRLREWQGPGGRPNIANTGSWVYEPLLVHRAERPHPYWPGGAIVLESGRDPQAIALLDDLDASDLH
jgi:UDP-2,3-diacylglucosamine pyrophosphatase LpxH